MRHKTMLKNAISHDLMGVDRTNLFRSSLKLRLGLLLLMGAGLFVACSGDEKGPNGGETPVIPDVPVIFSSGLSDWSVSRAANGSWEEGDRLGIYMIPHVAEASAAANFSSTYAGTASNVPYLTSGSGESVALAVVSGNNAILFPTNGSQVNFVAYSPYKAETNIINSHVYKVDVSNQSPAKAIDLLYHKGTGAAYSKNNKNVKLGFTHQLSKLKIGLVPASGTEADLTDATITLTGFPTTANFNLSTGVLGNLSGINKSITPVKDAASSAGRATFEAIVVPHTGDSYTRNVSFRVNGTNYTCPLPTSAAFKAGAVHSYNFQFTGTKVEPAQELVSFGDGGTASWGDYQLSVGKFTFNLAATRTSGNTVTISTNAPSALTYALSNNADIPTADKPEWITGLSLSNPTPDGNGWNSYTLTFGTDYHINSNAAPRTGYIRLEVAGMTLPVRVNQAADGYYVREPEPASFNNLVVAGKTGNTFTLATNAQDEEIAAATKVSWITIQTLSRSAVAADGTSTWTIGFDVAANTTIDARTGNIEVTIGGIKKTVTVSQVAMSVHDPVPASFDNLPVGGSADNTFTIETNAQDASITATTKVSWITNLSKKRSAVAADGTSTWTIGFDVTANTTISARTGNIEVTIGGVKKTVNVSQAGISVSEPSQTSFPNLAVGGETGKTFTITTNTSDESITVNCPAWITNLTKTRSTVAADGSSTWTISFDVTANTTTSVRTGNIEVTIGGQKKTIPVSQIAMYVNAPNPAKIDNVIAAGKTGNTFTIETNSTAIIPTSLTATNESMITNLKAERSVKDAANGIYLWTVTFDVLANTTISARSASISINIGGITKTVTVSQVAMSVYVNNPVPASFSDLPVSGATDNLFTIETNAPDANITITCPAWITIKTKSRSAVAADGSSTWTIGFDVSANTTINARSGDVEVTIHGTKKTVTVSQIAMYVGEPSRTLFNVAVTGATDNLFTIETNAPDANITVTCPAWITIKTKSRSAVAADGSSTWTISFDVSANTTINARSGNIEITIGGQKKTVTVSQIAVYVNAPVPTSFSNVVAAGKTGNTFTLTTNVQDENITVTTTNTSLITSLTPLRTVQNAANGIYLWTVTFDVTTNTTTSARSANIEVTIGGIKKTVTVSQVAMYVNNPVPANIANVIAAGATGKTFTIETNSTAIIPTSLTTTNESMITYLNAERSAKDAANGIYLWTVTFDVLANTTTSARSASISINIGGVTKTINVSQVAMSVYVNNPVPASFVDLPVGGAAGNTFTVTTNVPNEEITVTATNPSMITNLTSLRSVAADGSFTWTIGFDVTANPTTSVRSGNVEVTIGGQKKTVGVSQVALYVGAPSPNSFVNLAVGGVAAKTFTITTNAPDESITVTTTEPSMITNLTQSRGAVAADGTSTWTIGFDVTANTTTSVRSGNVEVILGGQKKTVNVSQTAMYVGTPSPNSFVNLAVGGVAGKTFTVRTNASDESITVTTTEPSMIKNLTQSRGAVAADGTSILAIGFDVTANPTTSARSGNIEVTIGGIKKTVTVSQVAMYVSEPNPASFVDLAVGGAAGNTFTLTTNAQDNDITLTTTEPSMITNLTKSRGAVAADGTSTWTIGFDVTANPTTSVRTGTIEVTISGVKKTVNVSQIAIYVGTPVPASFADLARGGATGNTFTITTNAQDEDITVTATNPSMITNLTPSRGAVASNGSSTWTIGFEVTASTTTSARSSDIEVTISGVTQTVNVSQVADSWIPPTNTSDGLTNCYMVAPGGSVTIPITRAMTLGNMPNSPDVTVEILWDDAGVISGTPTLTGYGASRTFTVTASSTQGNAVVVTKVGSSIYWYWHIWVTDYPDMGATYTTRNNYVFMDRNLGATFAGRGSGAGTGLFYGWGNPVPMPATGKPGDNLPGSGKVPNWVGHYNDAERWGRTTVKTKYDPCPAGWRVPTSSAFSYFTHGGIIDAFIQGFAWDKHALFPAAGYRDGNNGYKNTGTSGHYLTGSHPYTNDDIFTTFEFEYGKVQFINKSFSHDIGRSVRCVRE